MSAHAEEHFSGTNKLFSTIWVCLLLLTGIEIFLGYKPMPLQFMLTILLGLSIIKAALIIAYFMHLKFERLSLILTLVPMPVICICLLFVFFPDSFRSSGLRYKFKEPPPVGKRAVEEQKKSERDKQTGRYAVTIALPAKERLVGHTSRSAKRSKERGHSSERGVCCGGAGVCSLCRVQRHFQR